MLIIDKLKNYNSLSESEQSVATKLIELKDDIKSTSIRELASISYTATSAVTRLCNKLGYKGYSDFKEAYLSELIYFDNYFNEVDANVPFGKDDSLSRVCNSIAYLYEEASKDTLSLIDYQKMSEAIDLLNKAQNIYVICIGVGLDIAKVFADRMMRIGKKISISDNLNSQFYQSYNANKNDSFIVISYTGTTLRTRTYFENIKKSDASCILITSVGEKYLSQNANVTLHMTTREKLYSNIGTFSSNISTMLILDMLYSGLFHKDYDKNFERKKQLSRDYEPNRVSSNTVMDEE